MGTKSADFSSIESSGNKLEIVSRHSVYLKTPPFACCFCALRLAAKPETTTTTKKGGLAAKVNKWKKKAKADRKTMETQNWNKHERLKCCSPPFSVGYPITWFIGPTIQTDEKKFKFKFPFFPPFIFFKGLLCVLHNSYIITLSLSGLLGKRKKRERGGKRNKI